MNTKAALLLPVTLAAALGAGYLLGLRQRDSSAATAAPGAAVPLSSVAAAGIANDVEPLRLENERLRRLLAQERRMATEFEAQASQLRQELDAARRLAAVAADAPAPRPPAPPMATERSRPAQPLDATGALSDDYVRAEGVSDDARAKIDQLLRDTRRHLRELELKHAEVKYAADNELIISVKPFVEEGRAAAEALTKSLEGVLKSEAAARLRQALLNPLGRGSCNTGAGKRDLIITTEIAEDGRPMYTIRDSSNAGGSGSGAPYSVALAIDGAGEALGGSAMNMSSLQIRAGSNENGASSYSRTLRTREIPEQYAHFIAEEK